MFSISQAHLLERMYKKSESLCKNVIGSSLVQAARVPTGATLLLIAARSNKHLKVPKNLTSLEEWKVSATLILALTMLNPELKMILDEAKHRYHTYFK